MEVIYGGVISILTLVVAKVFELKQKKLEHNNSLEIIFFEKKISAAETAITNFSRELSFFNLHLSINEKLVSSKLEEYPFLLKQRDYINQDYDANSKLTERSLGKEYLYFDIEGYLFSDNQNYSKFITILAEIDKLDNEIKIQSNLLEDFKDNKAIQDKIFEIISHKAKEYIPYLKEMIDLLEKARSEAFSNLTKIKNEMKKYDPK